MTTYRNIPNVEIEDAKIIHKNFKGAGGRYNREGDRGFSVVIPNKEMAEDMIADGWNVKIRAPKEEGDEPFYYIGVSMKFGVRPPVIKQVLDNGRIIDIREESLDIFDDVHIISADIAIRPYQWEQPDGSSGVKAYLKELYIRIEESSFAKKYRNDD